MFLFVAQNLTCGFQESVRTGNNKRQNAESGAATSAAGYGQVTPHSSKYRTDESYAEAVEAGPALQEPYGARRQQQNQQGS